jgi:F-box protein, helicase, 18
MKSDAGKPPSVNLTAEQQAIINSAGDIRINAVAGSGKTTTVIEYARTRPPGARILYLAFNKTVKLEAVEKFGKSGLQNVTVETAHSLAYRHIVFRYGYKVRAQGYKSHEIAALLQLPGNGQKHGEHMIASHIGRFIAYFCNSDKARVQQLNYLDVVADPKAKAFVQACYKAIEDGTRLLLAKMDKGEIDITHDFYLKKFQLSRPALPYDYILFDEGQDASAAMVDIFLSQKAVKVIVGDKHQQIYSWRYAINSLEKAEFKSFALSASFRFNQVIANLAMQVLEWKEWLSGTAPLAIAGKGGSKTFQTRATIARSNLGLLMKAIEYISEQQQASAIHFEGNLNSYIYADEGASLYDVLNLQNGKHAQIRDRLIASMQTMAELEQYIEQTEDPQLGMMVEIVKEYGNDIPRLLKMLKEQHTDDREQAVMVFSTVHKAKGMEYDSVELVDDFISEARLERLLLGEQKETYDPGRVAEEVNLLYVAITRARNRILIPEGLLPKNFPASAHILVLRKKKEPAKPADNRTKELNPPAKRKLRRINSEEKEAYQTAYFLRKKMKNEE